MHHNTFTKVGTTSVTVPGKTEAGGTPRRTLIHRVSCAAAFTVTETADAQALWDAGTSTELFLPALRAQKAGSDLVIAATGKISVQYSYES